jgi:hypothetical protein
MEYLYKVNESYDIGMLDSLIRNNSIFLNNELDGVSFCPGDNLLGTLSIIFSTELETDEESVLRRLVAQAGASLSTYKQWCLVCAKWFEQSSCGQPIYCNICQTPYMADLPYGDYTWSVGNQQLSRWTEIKVFIPFKHNLVSIPNGGVELSNIVMRNTLPPIIQTVEVNGFSCSIVVGVNSVMWENTMMQFSWKVIP